MAIKINSNGASLSAQRQVTRTSDSLGRVFERLSSGQRINKASDDAAGLAIATSINTKGKVLAQASRNINDGISSLNVTQAALRSQNNILNRLSELAEQSANGTYTSAQRKAIAPGYTALVNEYERIANTTTFNGQQLLAGGTGGVTLQIGSDGTQSSNLQPTAIAANILSGISVFRGELFNDPSNIIDNSDIFYFFDNVTSLDSFHSLIGGSIFYQSVTASDGSSQEAYYTMLVGRGGVFQPTTGLYAFGITVDANGQRIGFFGNPGSTGAGTIASPASSVTVSLTNLVGFPNITLSLTIPQNSVQVITGATDKNGTTRLDATGVESQERARSSLPILENIRVQNDLNQGKIGATLSRLATAQSVTVTSQDAYKAAESRIRDADVAYDAVQLTRLSILQNAGLPSLAKQTCSQKLP